MKRNRERQKECEIEIWNTDLYLIFKRVEELVSRATLDHPWFRVSMYSHADLIMSSELDLSVLNPE